MRQDVLVLAPPAVQFVSHIPPSLEGGVGLTPQDIIAMQQAEIRTLRSDLEKLRVSANTIANTAAVLAYLAQPADGAPVVVPREVRDRFKGDVKLSVRSTEEGTEVRWVTRPKDHSFEGRADG